jgi:hypothetical protein
MSVTAVANLASQTGETIRIDFESKYSPPSGGSSAWNIVARNIKVTLTVPEDRPLPTSFQAQLSLAEGRQAERVAAPLKSSLCRT